MDTTKLLLKISLLEFKEGRLSGNREITMLRSCELLWRSSKFPLLMTSSCWGIQRQLSRGEIEEGCGFKQPCRSVQG